tara:strand:- start:280 stop:540 length:261 start_codon:yes stop_codon:yes gene_type:complete
MIGMKMMMSYSMMMIGKKIKTSFLPVPEGRVLPGILRLRRRISPVVETEDLLPAPQAVVEVAPQAEVAVDPQDEDLLAHLVQAVSR